MNIVAIRPDALGDSLVTFPILVEIRKKYPDSHITFIGNAGAMPLAKAWEVADEVYSYEKQWAEFFSPKDIDRPDLLHLFQHTDLALIFALDTEQAKKNLLEAGVREVITVPIFYKDLVQISDVPLHMIEYWAKWIRIPIPEPEYIVLPNIGNEVIPPSIPPIAIHPGSGSAYRRWPIASFTRLIVSLLRQHYPILLLAGPSENTLLNKILRRVWLRMPRATKSGMLTILDNAPLMEVTQHIKGCGCFIGHDTGTSHLAALLRLPTIVLYDDTQPSRFRPLGPTVEVLQEIPIENLSVEQVLKSVLRMYNSHHTQFAAQH